MTFLTINENFLLSLLLLKSCSTLRYQLLLNYFLATSIERSAVFQQNIDLSFLHSVAGFVYFPVFSSPNTYIYWNMVVIAEYR